MANQPGKNPRPTDLTYVETSDEIRKALHARLAAAAAGKLVPAKEPPPAPVAPPVAAPEESEPQQERPQLRPPMGLLCVLDDGQSADGEWVRLRADRCVIGRTEGDVQIPHDVLMSTRHAEITRVKAQGGYRWLLADLKSTNGSFVRIGGTVLRPGTEFLIGGGRYRFDFAGGPPPGANPEATQAWAGGPVAAAAAPTLVELLPQGPGQRFILNVREVWIGHDARACRIARPDDPLLNARHARLYRDAQGQWHVENNNTLNGLWLRVEIMPLDVSCQFRLGEQRFLFMVV